MALGGYNLRAGDLRNRITFQTRTETQDGTTGAVAYIWADSFTCWADIEPLSGRELIAAQQLQSGVTHNVMVRYRSELSDPKTVAGMRIVFGTRYFNILACMDQDSRRRAVVLQVEEGLTKT